MNTWIWFQSPCCFLSTRARVCSVTRSCLSACHAMDCSPPGSSIRGIFQARVLEWVAISFSRDLPNPGIKPWSPALQAESLPLSHQWSPSTAYSWSNKRPWSRCLDISQGVVGRGTCHPAYTKWVGDHSGPPTFNLTHIWGRYRSPCSAS